MRLNSCFKKIPDRRRIKIGPFDWRPQSKWVFLITVIETFNPPEIAEPLPPSTEEPPEVAERRSKLAKLVRKQIRSFTALFAKVISDEDADAVHDLRVCTRRIQQLLTGLVPDKTVHKTRAIRRTLRRVRRALGEWRNCDVALQWVSRTERRTANPNRRRGWALVRESIAAERKRAINKARRQLLKSDGLTLSQRTQQLIALPPERLGSLNPDSEVRASIAQASAQWENVLAHAMADRTVENIHAFRIQLKRMRYRVELARDLGNPGAKPLIEWFKSLQDRLGRWHDRQELSRFITRALADSELLLNQPRVAVELLKEVEKDIALSVREVDAMFRLATASEGRRRFDSWVKSYCADGENVQAGAALETPEAAEERVTEDQAEAPAAASDTSTSTPFEPVPISNGPGPVVVQPAPDATNPSATDSPAPMQQSVEHVSAPQPLEGEAKS